MTPGESPGPDYARVFDVAPAPLLLLTPDLRVVHANQAMIDATGRRLVGSTGRMLFDVLPAAEPGASWAESWIRLRDSLELVRDTRRPDTVPVQRYAVPATGGGFLERFWSHCTVPVLDEQGEVLLLLHRAEDVTDYVHSHDAHQPGPAHGLPLAGRVQRAEADLFARTRELERAVAELQASSDRERRTAQQLAGLATTVSALSAAESRAELLRQMFRHARRALRADVLAVALLEPGGSHLAVVDNRGGPEQPGQRLPLRSPVPMAAAAAGRPIFQGDAGENGSAAPLPGLRAWAALPLRIGRRPLGSLTVGWDDPRFSTTTTSACSRPSPRSVPRRSTGSPGGRRNDGRPTPPAAWPRASSAPC